MTDGDQLAAELRNCTGSEVLYSHHFNARFTYTEGAKVFAMHAGNGAYWFLDLLATEPAVQKHVLAEGLTSCRLVVNDDKSFRIELKDADDKVVWERTAQYTDCPKPPVKEEFGMNNGCWFFWLAVNTMSRGEVVTLLVPNEY